MFKIPFGLHSQLPTVEEMDEHRRALARLTRDPRHHGLFEHLYGCLSILDSKSSSLLVFNSIVILVYSIFMGRERSLTLVEQIFIAVGLITILVSCFFLLFVVWVVWSDTKDLSDADKHALTLLNARRSRTLKYRRAWWLALAGLVALSLFLGWHVFADLGHDHTAVYVLHALVGRLVCA